MRNVTVLDILFPGLRREVLAATLAPVLAKAEQLFGREINVTSYSADEFRKKVKKRDHFLATVLRGDVEFVKGEQRDLDAITGSQ